MRPKHVYAEWEKQSREARQYLRQRAMQDYGALGRVYNTPNGEVIVTKQHPDPHRSEDLVELSNRDRNTRSFSSPVDIRYYVETGAWEPRDRQTQHARTR